MKKINSQRGNSYGPVVSQLPTELGKEKCQQRQDGKNLQQKNFNSGRRSHLRLSRVSNCFPFLRLQSSRQSVLRTWKTSSKKKVLDASRNWSKISTSDSHIVDEFGELYFNFQQHVPDLWLLLLKVEEKDAKNELQSPFLRFLVANEHKLPLLLVRRKCRRKGC